MWNRMMVVFAGQPVIVRSNCAVAAVMAPVASFVVFRVKVPLPAHDASASAMAGTSFEVLRSARNVYLSCGVGAGVAVGAVVGATVGDGAAAVPPHAAARSAVAIRLARRRIDTSLACTRSYARPAVTDDSREIGRFYAGAAAWTASSSSSSA